MNTSNRSQHENTPPPVPGPNEAVFYNNRGEVYLREGKVDKAINDFNIAVKLQPELADAYCNRGNAYLLKGEIDKAIEDYSRSIKHAS